MPWASGSSVAFIGLVLNQGPTFINQRFVIVRLEVCRLMLPVLEGNLDL